MIQTESWVIEYKLQTYFSLTAEENTTAKYVYGIYFTECTKETIWNGRVARKTRQNFKHVSVNCIKQYVYKKYTYGFPLGFKGRYFSGTTCKMIHIREKDREERANFDGSLKARTVQERLTTFCFFDAVKIHQR